MTLFHRSNAVPRCSMERVILCCSIVPPLTGGTWEQGDGNGFALALVGVLFLCRSLKRDACIGS
jgi:hypothetical protein